MVQLQAGVRAQLAGAERYELLHAWQVIAHKDALAPGNALGLVRRYDIVVDASDNAPTRYLLSDACVVAGRPLVSGAALGTDGQVTVYNQGPDGAAAPQIQLVHPDRCQFVITSVSTP